MPGKYIGDTYKPEVNPEPIKQKAIELLKKSTESLVMEEVEIVLKDVRGCIASLKNSAKELKGQELKDINLKIEELEKLKKDVIVLRDKVENFSLATSSAVSTEIAPEKTENLILEQDKIPQEIIDSVEKMFLKKNLVTIDEDKEYPAKIAESKAIFNSEEGYCVEIYVPNNELTSFDDTIDVCLIADIKESSDPDFTYDKWFKVNLENQSKDKKNEETKSETIGKKLDDFFKFDIDKINNVEDLESFITLGEKLKEEVSSAKQKEVIENYIQDARKKIEFLSKNSKQTETNGTQKIVNIINEFLRDYERYIGAISGNINKLKENENREKELLRKLEVEIEETKKTNNEEQLDLLNELKDQLNQIIEETEILIDRQSVNNLEIPVAELKTEPIQDEAVTSSDPKKTLSELEKMNATIENFNKETSQENLEIENFEVKELIQRIKDLKDDKKVENIKFISNVIEEIKNALTLKMTTSQKTELLSWQVYFVNKNKELEAKLPDIKKFQEIVNNIVNKKDLVSQENNMSETTINRMEETPEPIEPKQEKTPEDELKYFSSFKINESNSIEDLKKFITLCEKLKKNVSKKEYKIEGVSVKTYKLTIVQKTKEANQRIEFLLKNPMSENQKQVDLSDIKNLLQDFQSLSLSGLNKNDLEEYIKKGNIVINQVENLSEENKIALSDELDIVNTLMAEANRMLANGQYFEQTVKSNEKDEVIENQESIDLSKYDDKKYNELKKRYDPILKFIMETLGEDFKGFYRLAIYSGADDESRKSSMTRTDFDNYHDYVMAISKMTEDQKKEYDGYWNANKFFWKKLDALDVEKRKEWEELAQKAISNCELPDEFIEAIKRGDKDLMDEIQKIDKKSSSIIERVKSIFNRKKSKENYEKRFVDDGIEYRKVLENIKAEKGNVEHVDFSKFENLQEELKRDPELKNLFDSLLLMSVSRVKNEDVKDDDVKNIIKEIASRTGIDEASLIDVYNTQTNIAEAKLMSDISNVERKKMFKKMGAYLTVAGAVTVTSLVTGGIPALGLLGYSAVLGVVRLIDIKRSAESRKKMAENKTKELVAPSEVDSHLYKNLISLVALKKKMQLDNVTDIEPILTSYIENAIEYDGKTKEEKDSIILSLKTLYEIDKNNSGFEERMRRDQEKQNEKNKKFSESALGKIIESKQAKFASRFLNGGSNDNEKMISATTFASLGICARELPVLRNLLLGIAGYKFGGLIGKFLVNLDNIDISKEGGKRVNKLDKTLNRILRKNKLTKKDHFKFTELKRDISEEKFKKEHPDKYLYWKSYVDKYEERFLKQSEISSDQEKADSLINTLNANFEKRIKGHKRRESFNNVAIASYKILGAVIGAGIGINLAESQHHREVINHIKDQSNLSPKEIDAIFHDPKLIGDGKVAQALIDNKEDLSGHIKQLLTIHPSIKTNNGLLENLRDHYTSNVTEKSYLDKLIEQNIAQELKPIPTIDVGSVQADTSEVENLGSATTPPETNPTSSIDVSKMNTAQIHEMASHGIPVKSSISETLNIDMPKGSTTTLITFDERGVPTIHENVSANIVGQEAKIFMDGNRNVFVIAENPKDAFWYENLIKHPDQVDKILDAGKHAVKQVLESSSDNSKPSLEALNANILKNQDAIHDLQKEISQLEEQYALSKDDVDAASHDSEIHRIMDQMENKQAQLDEHNKLLKDVILEKNELLQTTSDTSPAAQGSGVEPLDTGGQSHGIPRVPAHSEIIYGKSQAVDWEDYGKFIKAPSGSHIENVTIGDQDYSIDVSEATDDKIMGIATDDAGHQNRVEFTLVEEKGDGGPRIITARMSEEINVGASESFTVGRSLMENTWTAEELSQVKIELNSIISHDNALPKDTLTEELSKISPTNISKNAVDIFLNPDKDLTIKLSALQGILEDGQRLDVRGMSFARVGNDIYYMVDGQRGIKLDGIADVNRILTNIQLAIQKVPSTLK